MREAWTTPTELREVVKRRWRSQRLLREWALGELAVPYTLPLRRPARAELTSRFDEVRAWIEALRADVGYEIEWEAIQSRGIGPQRLPRRVRFDAPEHLFGFIGESERFRLFARTLAAAVAEWPQARSVLAAMPFAVVEQAPNWSSIAAVLRFFLQHPRPGSYLRALDIPGVDTKFIEERVTLMGALLDAVLPPSAVLNDVSARERRGFERRFGLLVEPPAVRLRILDEKVAPGGLTDLTVPVGQLARLSLDVDTVFITENKMNGLAFPEVPRSAVIFGVGYGISTLFEVPWLAVKRLFYWGDIDTHGFLMLSTLRERFRRTRSMLMDEDTLLAGREQWTTEPQPIQIVPSCLDPAERALFTKLSENHWAERVRLEQERVAFARVLEAVSHLSSGPKNSRQVTSSASQ